MATEIIVSERNATVEIDQFDCNFEPFLPDGETLESATATHIPPSGAAMTPTVGTIVANVVPVKLGAYAVTGWHVLNVLGTTTPGGLKHLMTFKIPVDF